MGSVVIHVNDAMKSTEWYWDKLAFETVGLDVFVRAAGFQGVLIDLCELCNDRRNDRPDGRTGIWFRCGELLFRMTEGMVGSC